VKRTEKAGPGPRFVLRRILNEAPQRNGGVSNPTVNERNSRRFVKKCSKVLAFFWKYPHTGTVAIIYIRAIY
jgi:hypothetical protein